jgi:uncharacterized membrane protein
MRAHLQYLWYQLTASLWLVPAVMIMAAIGLALGMLYLDSTLPPKWFEPLNGMLRIGPEGARQVLATIASSMVTVASLVFSMTLVTLTLAASQLGPRLITRFMRDTINQVVLGTFLATFIYALLVLETVSGTESRSFVPHLALTVGLVLTLISLFWLIFFIHHVAVSIQADAVIADVSEELSGAIANRFPQVRASGPGRVEMPFLDRQAEPPGAVRSLESGYVQAIDGRALLDRASDRDLLIKVEKRPGDFVIADAPILLVWPRERLTAELAAALREPIVIGRQRTPTQDIDFAVSALLEIALRALSPGLNDPQTAISCIDRLAEALAELMQRPEAPSTVPDDDGALRLIVTPASFEAVAFAAFNPIREAAASNARVLRRLAEVLASLAGFAGTGEQLDVLARQARALEEVCRAARFDDLRREEVDGALRMLCTALAEATPD